MCPLQGLDKDLKLWLKLITDKACIISTNQGFYYSILQYNKSY